MEKTISAFGFRYEKWLGERVLRFCRENVISLNTLVELVLVRLGKLHDEGRMCLQDRSRFLVRRDTSDRKTTVLMLNAGTREMIRNLAFSYRVSMAEVIRLGLEMFLDLEEFKTGKSDKIIHIYRRPVDLVHTVLIVLYPALPSDRVPYPLLL